MNSFNYKKKWQILHYSWVILVVCLISVTISYGIRFSFGVFFKSLEQEFVLTRALTSSVFSVYMLVGALSAILGGWAADRYGPRVVFMSMGIFSFIGLALTSQVNELWHLFFSYSLFVALGTGATYPIASSVVTRYFHKRRGLALSIVTSGSGLGSILVAPISAYFITGYGWRLSYLVLGAIALVVMTPLSLLLKHPPHENTILSNNNKKTIITVNGSDKADIGTGELSIIKIIENRNFLIIISIWFFYAFCLFMIMTHLVPYARDLGINSLQAASLISVSGFANIPVRIAMGLSADKFGRKPIALICASLMTLSMLWLTQSTDLWMLYLFAVIFGAAYGGLAPPMTATVGDIFGVHHIGLVFGLLDIGWVCGGAVGPALAGYLFDVTGNYYSAFLYSAIAALLIVILILLLRMPKK